MRALEPRALGDARHAAVLAREMMLEVHPLERFTRLAIRTIEGYLRQRAGRRARGERALHVFELYFFLERREREVFHHAFQLGKVPRPWVMTQRVERGDRQPPRRAGARLDELCQHEGSQIRHVFGKLGSAGSLSVSSARRVPSSTSKSCFSARLRTSTGEKDTSRTFCFSARGNRNSKLRCSGRPRRLRSATNSTPPAALPRSSEGASASSSALARNGAPGATSSRAKSSGRMPRSPRSIKGAADCASCARRFLASASAVERPSAASAS